VQFRASGRLNATVMPAFELTADGVTITTRCISIDLSGRPLSKAAACS
jgi:phage protein D